MGKKSVTWPLDKHTKAKHDILRRYLQAWFPILSRWNGRILYIDGFAGPGEYSEGEHGSPLIAINEAKNHTLKLNSEILFLFIEKDEQYCEHLQSLLNTIVLPNNMKYEVVCGSFDETLNSTLDYVDEQGKNLAPTFAFIDPFGYSDTPFSVIKRILQNEKCEVLITFMSGFINRFKNEPWAMDHLNNLFGTSDWNHEMIDNEKNIVNFYQNRLSTVAEYVRSFDMSDENGRTIYRLIFGTNSYKGLKKMKEAMWKVDETGTFSFSDRTDPFQSVLFEPEPNYEYLKKLILDKFKGKVASIDEIEKFVVINTPFRESHFKSKILKPMENANEIEILETDRKKRGTYPEGTVIKFL